MVPVFLAPSVQVLKFEQSVQIALHVNARVTARRCKRSIRTEIDNCYITSNIAIIAIVQSKECKVYVFWNYLRGHYVNMLYRYTLQLSCNSRNVL